MDIEFCARTSGTTIYADNPFCGGLDMTSWAKMVSRRSKSNVNHKHIESGPIYDLCRPSALKAQLKTPPYTRRKV
ncbi:hypothetical protein Moror_12602 [Moniliophthora roreri MCA 2997]|uniref:Uncharacterized protein n=1 Tax=Moniliophthora roreri (strain MCA 2997) TaxID=1381753 RepID=V2XSZ8_MONRO|nr:hypothetical protein Moror_12602 [Moniliophthora roreri MCA 2997]